MKKKIKDIVAQALKEPEREDHEFFIITMVDTVSGQGYASGMINTRRLEEWTFTSEITAILQNGIITLEPEHTNVSTVEYQNGLMFEQELEEMHDIRVFKGNDLNYSLSSGRGKHTLPNHVSVIILKHFFEETYFEQVKAAKKCNTDLYEKLKSELIKEYDITNGMFRFLTENTGINFDINQFEESTKKLVDRLDKYKEADKET